MMLQIGRPEVPLVAIDSGGKVYPVETKRTISAECFPFDAKDFYYSFLGGVGRGPDNFSCELTVDDSFVTILCLYIDSSNSAIPYVVVDGYTHPKGKYDAYRDELISINRDTFAGRVPKYKYALNNSRLIQAKPRLSFDELSRLFI